MRWADVLGRLERCSEADLSLLGPGGRVHAPPDLEVEVFRRNLHDRTEVNVDLAAAFVEDLLVEPQLEVRVHFVERVAVVIHEMRIVPQTERQLVQREDPELSLLGVGEDLRRDPGVSAARDGAELVGHRGCTVGNVAAEVERSGRTPVEVVASVHEEGALRVRVPRDLFGAPVRNLEPEREVIGELSGSRRRDGQDEGDQEKSFHLFLPPTFIKIN
jgi:hypothetical protein